MEQIASDPSVNVEVWVERVSSPVAVEAEFHTQVLKLVQSISLKIYPVIPGEFAKKLKAHPMKIIFADASIAGTGAAYEYFLPPGLGSDELKILINPRAVMNNNEVFLLLAHAYFHALQYVVHPDPTEQVWKSEQWLREGLADNFEFLVYGGSNPNHQRSALTHSTTPLMGDYDVDHLSAEQYGHDMLYVNYILRECGGKSLFWKLAESTPEVFGADSVERALKEGSVEKPQCDSFEESATSFEIARFLNHEDVSSKNPDRYFLSSSTYAFPTPPAQMTDALLAQMKVSMRFQPVELSADVKIPDDILRDSKRVWIEKRFPYSVQESTPADLESWTQIIFRP
jgi:hypothetical protein